MHRSLRNLCVAMLAMALFVTGCDSEQPAQQPTQPPAEQPAEEAPAQEEAAAEVNEDTYVKAAFELNCVTAQIDDADKVNSATETIYSRHGFTQESFNQAKAAIGDKESVKLAVNTRMENCTEDLAKGFAGTDAEEAPADEEAATEEAPAQEEAAAAPAPAPRPAKVGTIHDRSISGANFEGTELRLNVANNFSVSGDFKGRREGRSFIIPITGEVGKDGVIKATGSRGKNSVEVGGRLTAQGARGTVSGTIFENNYSVRYNAQ